MAKTHAGNGIDFLALCLDGERLNHSELREVCQFVTGMYAENGPPDPAIVRGSALLADVLIKSRRREPRGFGRGSPSISSADIEDGLAAYQRFATRAGETDDQARERFKQMIFADEGRAVAVTPKAIDSDATVAPILKADAKRRGQVFELPPVGSAARAILEADAKARGRELPGDKSL